MKHIFMTICVMLVTSVTFAQTDAPDEENGFKFVDMGLPSGTLWATKNLGASNNTRYGNYFAYGETKPKSDYSWTSYIFTENQKESGVNKYTWADGYSKDKYYRNGNFIGDNKNNLDIEDDAAHHIWEGKWHIPTQEQFKELIDNTTQKWVDSFGKNHVPGYIIISKKNKKGIFMPAAGARAGYEGHDDGVMGFYWTSSVKGDWVTTCSMPTSHDACSFCFYSGGNYFEYTAKPEGLSIRPVCKKK